MFRLQSEGINYIDLVPAMQIDSRNFQKYVDLIISDIKSAHFVAFDCEFTGLVTQNSHIEGDFPDHQ